MCPGVLCALEGQLPRGLPKGRVLSSLTPVPGPTVMGARSGWTGAGVASGAAWFCAPIAAWTPSPPRNGRDGKSW